MNFKGPDLSLGPLPAIIYFALSEKDSLETDPFNQPVMALKDEAVRIYSIDLPAHEDGKSPFDAMERWAEKDLLSPFFDHCTEEIANLLSSGSVTKLGVMGLSRGGWVAMQMATRFKEIESICAFAPITKPKRIQSPPLNTDALSSKALRIYIGNHDTRVSTRSAFELIETLSEKVKRMPPFEMIITPSIGQHGHGTPKESFEAGAKWLLERLK